MAHGNRRRQRDASVPSLGDVDSLLSAVAPEVLIDPDEDVLSGSLLREIQDARLFTPEVAYSARSDLGGAVARVGYRGEFPFRGNVLEAMERPESVAGRLPKWANLPAFEDSARTLECVRRKVRKEVIFSLGKRKRRKGAGGKRRRDEWSNVRC